uniref:Uncharacterized protein n=1 Tax=Fundulus heteroclitus TaxID=8078 RepID=A0A3Q2QGE1_FUNHE
ERYYGRAKKETRSVVPNPGPRGPVSCNFYLLLCFNTPESNNEVIRRTLENLTAHWGSKSGVSPRNPKQKIIKRVIGLEGDFIRCVKLRLCFLVWTLGCHHLEELINPVSVGLLHGRASHIIWPPNRWQRIKPSLLPNRELLYTEEDGE